MQQVSVPETADRPKLVPDQQWVSIYIEQAIADFNSNSRTPQLLRCLAKEYPDLFFTAAAKHVESEVDSAAHRFLAVLLLRQEELFERLTNPARCSCKSAVQLFRNLLTVDTTLDFKLAKLLPGRDGSVQDNTLKRRHAARAIDILDKTSPGQRLLPVVGHLTNCEDAHISSKAALMVGHRVSNPVWLARQLVREDPRLRANVLESTWGAKSGPAIRILLDCANDPNNRVAGNALIGLYLAGCPDVAERALAMSISPLPGRRSTAAWAMGKIGSQEFLGRLTELMRDENPKVRSTALRSLAEIGRAEEARPVEKKPEPVAVTPVPVAEPVAAGVPQTPFDLRLDGSSFKMGRRSSSR
jgi:hypothetical protein